MSPSDKSPTERPNPESFEANKSRIRKEILATAGDSSVVIPKRMLEDLVEVVVAECVELRERIADRIIGPLIGRYESFDDNRLEMLAFVILNHFENPQTGIIELAYEPEFEAPEFPKLRLVPPNTNKGK